MNINLLIPNLSGSNVSKILVVLFVVLLFSSVPLAFAQFVPSSSANASSGGGGRINYIAPTLENIITFSDGTTTTSIDITQNVITNFTANVGAPVTITLNVTDDYGADDINFASLYTDFGDKPDDMNLYYANNFNEYNQVSQTFYEWENNSDDVLFDYSGNVTFDEPITSTASNIFSISYTLTWSDVMSQSQILFKVEDFNTNYSIDTLPITLEIIPVEEDTSVITSEPVVSVEPIASEPVTAEPIVSESIPTEEEIELSPQDITLDDVSKMISYTIQGGVVQDILPNPETNSIIIPIDAANDGSITIVLPREVIDAKFSDGTDDSFFVLVDGEESSFEENSNETERVITIPFLAGTDTIEVVGTFVVPEFGSLIMMILVVSIVSVIVISSKSKLVSRI